MIKVENIDVWGFEHAIRGMHNPMNSWNKSDSYKCEWELTEDCDKCDKLNSDNTGACLSDREFYCIGKNDLDLMRRLFKAGTEHRKYLRQIFVSMDITAPLYFWKQADQYKVETVTNSCSTMHKIAAKEFTLDDFSHEHLTRGGKDFLLEIIGALNEARSIYVNYDEYVKSGAANETIMSKKDVWWQMIQLLPSSYNQKRTLTMNYENVFTIIRQRTSHKLDEWNKFVEILKTLPYVKEIGGLDEKGS